MIRLVGVSKSFGSFRLGPLSMTIERGSYCVLLGPSGAGKSMLLQTIAGLHELDAGRLELGGRDCTAASPETRQVGVVFQQGALFPHLSVSENIGYGLWARRVPAAVRRQCVNELLQVLRIEGLVNRPVATLSGGEAQKVAIARALALRPEVLLLDEPLGAIDYGARLELQEELGRIHRELGLTTLHVTHSREEARSLGSHCAVLLDGRLVQSGQTGELLAAPRCLFVAHFLGAGEHTAGAPPCSKACITAPGRCDLPE